MSEPWLVIIDPQTIFASPTSQWGSPAFPDVIGPINRLVEAYHGHIIVTRWIPSVTHEGSWHDYFQRWAFADRPEDDPLFDLVEEARAWVERPTVDITTFSKWGSQLSAITGTYPHLLLTGVSTDCCVIATALAATDAGAWVKIVSDGCAGSSPQNHEAALTVMDLYSPQIEILTASEALSGIRRR
ncbi:cysteine hydrolase family protein [Cutibacterium sp.]|uniref:cysteine hydrolase family protein n=1 Tax=Cutibacterium sp. TaxID=1912221 RepID=UPI0026DB0399|nr:cysteine hydrolase [Cutibacterium sp.]MDO4411523.1 cysteine hydrolase [Cutibacterium sp.]